MPISLARKLLICAAVDGLIIQPLAPKGQRASQPLKLKYGEATVSSIPRDQLPDNSRPNTSFEAFGVIGVFTVSRLSYLITITGRQQVAQIRGYPVYVVTDVALTPCTSQAEAESAVRHTSVQLRRAASSGDKKITDDATESETDGDTASVVGNDDALDEVQSDRESVTGKEIAGETEGSKGDDQEGRSSIAEDVIQRKGSYGRFAQRWFSHKGWVQDQKRNMGISDSAPQTQETPVDSKAKKQEGANKTLSHTVVAETASQGVATAVSTGESLLPKLLRMAHIWFGTSRSFYFSYDVDITQNLCHKGAKTPDTPETPLSKSADPLYFWNRHLLGPFTTAKEDALLLPLMQGFVGQREFIVDRNPPQADSDKAPDSVEMNDMTPPPPPDSEAASPPADGQERSPTDLRPNEKKFLITVVSRRSIQRAGLRYLRRGVDDNGFAANAVETEQLLSTPSWDDSNIFSFVQVRGSIPLFFTQSPYSLKPAAVMQHSDEANLRALSRHFEQLRKRYDGVQIVNLVEKHGVESKIGEAFERNVEAYNKENTREGEDPKLGFEWFDFHSACRGMKFENVSLLLDTLGPKIEAWGSTVEAAARGDSNNSREITNTQKGALRTNCMDCLDRTNVCQSSFAKYMLDLQLKQEGFDMGAQVDQTNSWFNTLWADNGDAISKQYASTAAMKGDYTRTRKRDYRGMVNDLGLSLTRFYNGMVNDYFSQAAIDFLLGNVTSLVFEEFESTMMTKDPAVSMAKMREQAIETSQKIVVADDSEDFIGGWTLLSPHHSDTIKSLPFEEVVLLLTDVALYLCRFDWKLDKVSSFERVELSHVLGIQVGTYIISTVSPAQADEEKNIGLVVTYEPGKEDVKRVNTRSLSSISGPTTGTAPGPEGQEEGAAAQSAGSSGGILAPIFGGKQEKAQPPKKLALKASYSQSSIADMRSKGSGKVLSEAEQVNVIASEIERLAFINQPLPKQEGDKERKSLVEHEDIISLAEAKKNTGLLETWGHAVKKLVWA
ncbi:SacI homology domain-containing protein [Xylariales sp. AK1849]|nr:SacI homology domain-containing protein [Xylariales sp. AK1849]